MANFILGERRQNGQAPGADAEGTPHADFEREGLDREGSLPPVDTHRIESAPLGEERRVASCFGDPVQLGQVAFP